MDSETLIAGIENKLLNRSRVEKSVFLSLFMYRLTETVRWLGSEQPPSPVLVCQMKAINEIQHRIASRVMNLLKGSDEWSERDFVLAVLSFAEEGGCKTAVQWTLNEAISAVRFGND